MALAGEESAKSKAAKEVIKSLTAQVLSLLLTSSLFASEGILSKFPLLETTFALF